ncbi:uncharacterized protein LOC131686814 [Topomyia yanbarensis]|uniref:uncharacterized protein LOC131686814 n=1 Tax=Topomyia yanbarensis TaxID=2498891 RepID=UPI00273C9183|nr:uncharacterized protein LOC131686814 [Topomyia yanbarensis]
MKQLLFNACAFLLFVPISPLILLFFITLLIYRTIVTNLIKLFHGSHFRGFLEGLDAIWNVEKGSSRSMINLMFFIEAPVEGGHEKVPAKFLHSVRQTITEKLMGTCRPYPRLFWTRRQTLGYCYWTDSCKLAIEEFVRFMNPIGTDSETKFVREEKLRVAVAEMSNQLLPDGHAACWELLIGTEPVEGKSKYSVRYPVLLRLHHTAGDGMAIVRLILDTITGDHKALAARISAHNPQKQTNQRSLNFVQLVKILFNGPAFILRMMFQKSEKNCLSGGRITDNKVVSWCHEAELTSEKKSIIEIVKSTKQLIPEARFSDIFLLALASSLHRYFEAKGEPYQNGVVSVIVPGRSGSEAKSLKIKNRFTTRRQMLHISQGIQLDDPDRLSKLRQQLSILAQGSASTRSASSHAVISIFISSLSNILPIALLRLLVSSFRANVVFSILPEIGKVSFQEHEMAGPTLFLPNTGNISVCIAAVTFGDKVHLGILADRSVIPSANEAHSILQEIVNEIERMGVVLEDAPKQTTVRFE